MHPALQEHELQVSVFQEVRLLERLDDRWSLLVAVPNGGARAVTTAKKMRAEGLRKGFPDLFFFVPCQGYHGLAVEVKVHPNQPSKSQKEVLRLLANEGYLACVIWDYADLVMNVLKWYIEEQTCTLRAAIEHYGVDNVEVY